MPDMDQEEYLTKASYRQILARGAKKIITEITSIKTLVMMAIIGLTYYGKIDSMWCIVGLMGLTGAKEIDFNQIVEVVKIRLSK